MGCTTLGQIEDDVRIAQQFQPASEAELAALRERAKRLAGPRLENWKVDTPRRASGPRHHDALHHGLRRSSPHGVIVC